MTQDIVNFTLTVEESDSYDLVAVVDDKIDLTLDTAINVTVIAGDRYEGEYTVKPTFEDKVLETAHKYMDEDVTVYAIQVSKVSNPYGGKTVYIGGIFDGE